MAVEQHPGGGRVSLIDAHWLKDPAAQRVLRLVEDGGFQARVVGGAVRNALLGLPVKDIDIATTAPAERVLALAQAAGLKAIPTGIDHGTVTVVVNQHPFELTTLRKDVETDGRHAKVAPTNDWSEDAARRDFTINALYCDARGQIFDPLGGLSDIAPPRIRFIGNADARIREDYLRILRFFRLTAAYGKGEPDAASLAACLANAEGLATLSSERVRAEMLRLLAAEHCAAMVALMQNHGLLDTLLRVASNVPLFTRVVAMDDEMGGEADPLLRLGALAASKPGQAQALRSALRLSNAETERLTHMGLPDRAFDPKQPEQCAKAYLYRHGREAFRDGVRLAWAANGASSNDQAWRTRARLAEDWAIPKLPVRGSEVVAAGLLAGPVVGKVVGDFEEWWIAAGFPHEEHVLAHALSRLVKAAQGKA